LTCNHRHRHAQLRQRFAPECLQGGRGIQLPADRLGNGKTCPYALTSLTQVLDRNRLVEVFAEQNWQIVLCQVDQALLSL
jgi:hypothetical protein